MIADNVFEPAMAEVGGILVLFTVFVSWNDRRIRDVEIEVPDLEPVRV
ncbi:MAG: hypothetical protein V3S62_07805 [Acidimicrobiia bacterium]